MSKPTFNIRPAAAADVPQVLPMVRAICTMHEKLDPERYAMLPDVVARYEHWFPERAEDPRSVFLVAESSNRLVAFLIATTETNIPIYQLIEFGFIHDIWVEPDSRSQGIAKAIVQEALARFRAQGIHQVRLETAALNDSARKLFTTCGFRVGTIDMLRNTD